MRRPLVAALVAVLVAAGCSDEPRDRAVPDPGAVVVASFNFAESELLAEVYAQALEDEGVRVRRELGLGTRELVLPALRQGLVDVVPEYVGSVLDATAPRSAADRSDLADVVAALDAAVAPWGLAVLEPSAASNQNVVVVRADLARIHDLVAISDLRSLAPSSTIGGPPECPRRSRCLAGLDDRYGLHFEAFVPLAGADLVRRALLDGVVDVGVLFSTDAALAGSELVALADDRHLQPLDDVVPLVRSAVLDDPRIRRALDEVSEELTTRSLRFVNWRLVNAGTSVADEARGWLVRHGLVAR